MFPSLIKMVFLLWTKCNYSHQLQLSSVLSLSTIVPIKLCPDDIIWPLLNNGCHKDILPPFQREMISLVFSGITLTPNIPPLCFYNDIAGIFGFTPPLWCHMVYQFFRCECVSCRSASHWLNCFSCCFLIGWSFRHC